MKPFSRLRDLLSKSTPGEWKPFDGGPWGGQGAGIAIGDDVEMWPMFDKRTDKGIDNSFFVAEAHNQLPRVLEALDVALAIIDGIYDDDERGLYNSELDTLKKIKELSEA